MGGMEGHKRVMGGIGGNIGNIGNIGGDIVET